MQPPVPGYPPPPPAGASAYPAPPGAYPPSPYGPNPYGPYGAQPYGGYGQAVRPGPRFGLPRPTAVAPVPGTAFGVALVEVQATASGPAVASLVTGIISILLSLVVLYFASADGPAVAGAFAILTLLVSAASVGLAAAGLQRIRRSAPWGAARGRGIAVAGLACGAVGFAGTALIMLVDLAAKAAGGA